MSVPTMRLTSTVVDTYLAARLNGDATLLGLLPSLFWRHEPPAGTAHPFGVWQRQGGPGILRGGGPALIWGDGLYLVKCVGLEEHLATMRDAMSRVIALLHGQGSSGHEGGTIVAGIWEDEYTLPETVGGVRYEHLGALIRFQVMGAAQ